MSLQKIDKTKLLKDAVKELNLRLEVLVASAFEAKEASTNPESKAENKYDTRGLEASYLASGQAQRAMELKKQIFQLEQVTSEDHSGQPIRVGSAVQLNIEEQEDKFFFILPSGGITLVQSGISIQSLTIEAPLGQKLFKKSQGDEFEFKGKTYTIVEVR